jgi:hypothetical protein
MDLFDTTGFFAYFPPLVDCPDAVMKFNLGYGYYDEDMYL